MYSKQRSTSPWWVALWIYVVTFFLVTLTFFQAANASKSEKSEEKKNSVSEVKTNEKTDKVKGSTKKGKGMLVIFETNQGNIKIKLNQEKAPVTVENFLKYVDSGFYAGTIFHRVIPDFMIQGGGFTSDMNQKSTNPPIKNEADNGLKNVRGSVAMARTNDPNSASAQFFINLKDNAFLDFTSKTSQGWGYAVFGEVVEGMDVVDKIAKVGTSTKSGYQDVPVQVIEVKATKRTEK